MPLAGAASEQDLSVDLSKYVIDVYSRCGPSLAARDTVAPAVEKLTDTSSLSRAARVTVEPAVEKLTDTSKSLVQKVNEFTDLDNQRVSVPVYRAISPTMCVVTCYK